MSDKQYIPYWIAVLININIVIGSAFFLGAQSISVKSGFLGPLTWLLCGVLLLPLINVFATFAQAYPEAGGLYVYSKKILGPRWGVVSCWGYFIGTTAGNAAVLHAFCQYLQKIPGLEAILQRVGLVDVTLEVGCAILFALLNLLNIQFLEVIQTLFTVLKIIPMVLISVGVFFVKEFPTFSFTTVQLSGALDSIPMVLFAYIGLEACCAVTDKIKGDGSRGPSRVIWTSFSIIVAIYVFLQLFVYLIYGTVDINPFLNILSLITTNATVIGIGNAILYAALLCSFLGGFYGVFFYNNWNLYAMGKDNVLPASSWLRKVNSNQIPFVCVFSQLALLVFLLVTTNKSYYLVTMSDIGVILAYCFTAIAFAAKYKNKMGFLAVLSCCFFIVISTISLVQSGFHNVLPFLVILLLGLGGYAVQSRYQ